MKIVKPIDVTDDVLIDSSIPMPDVSRGEVEWQGVSSSDLGATRNFPKLCSSDNVVFFASSSLGFRSTDGAKTWHEVNLNISSSSVSFSACDGSTFAVCTSDGKVSISSDGANSFSLSSFDFGGKNLACISVSGDSIAVISRDGFVYISEDGGSSFSSIGPIDDGVEFSRVSIIYGRLFAGSRRGSIYVNNSLSGGFLKRFELEGSTVRVSGFAEFEGVVIAVGEFGFIYRTTDLGESWHKGQDIPRTTEFFTVSKCKDFTFIGGMEGFSRSAAFISTDGGLTISKIESGIPDSAGIDGSLISTSSKLGDGFIFGVNVSDRLIKNIINRRNDEVIKSSTKRKYRCAVDATFDDPEVGVNLSPPTWVDIGAVNRWMPFDKQPSQQAVSDNPMYYKLKPGEFVRALSIFNISGVSSVNVKVTDPVDGVIYDRDFDLVDNSNVVDMWTYLTLPISFKKELIITDLVCFRESEIEITLHGEAPAVGAIFTGNESPVGRCVTGTGVRSNQFSIRKENGFGGFDIIQRGVGKIARFRVAYDISQIDYITNLLESIDSQYCVFIGELPNNKAISIYGILDPYQSDFETPTVNTLEFDVLGVL